MEGNRRGNCGEVVEGMKAPMAMVLAQTVFAGINIFYKLALNDGMDVRVLVAYRYLFAVAFLCPIAFFVERKNRPRLNWKILTEAFFCGLFGATLGQNFYVTGMKMTSATFVSALTNLTPAITFVLAVIFRLEKLDIRSISGQAKVIGTLVGLSGAMLLTFYKGSKFKLWSSKIDLLKSKNKILEANHESSHRVLGSFLGVGSCLCYGIWLIIQAKLAEIYPCHYSSAALICFMGGIQAIIVAICTQRHKDEWRVGFDIRLLSASYAGIISSGSIFPLMAWCVRKKGPLYTSSFNPLMLIMVAVLSSILFSEDFHLGSVLGSILIVAGLYLVIWGKGREVLNEPHVESIVISESIEVIATPTRSQTDLHNKSLEKCTERENKEG